MRVRGGEIVEEVLTPDQQIVADPEVLVQSFRGELDHAVGRAGYVADLGRVVDPAQKGVNAAGNQSRSEERFHLCDFDAENLLLTWNRRGVWCDIPGDTQT
jgi:hypothetical protein